MEQPETLEQAFVLELLTRAIFASLPQEQRNESFKLFMKSLQQLRKELEEQQLTKAKERIDYFADMLVEKLQAAQ